VSFQQVAGESFMLPGDNEGSSMRITAPLFMLLFCPVVALSQTNVLTYHYDNARTGQNTQERFLTPSNVRPNQFRRLFVQSGLDGDVYAQPLYVANVTLGSGTAQPGTTHNVVFVATEGDSVYAFDADNMDGANAQPLWRAHMACTDHDQSCTKYGAPLGARTILSGDPNLSNIDSCNNFAPQIGITGTPAIDAAGGILYVVTKTNEGGNAVQRLHALDVATGAEKLGKPSDPIAASVRGTAPDSVNGILSFSSLWQNQRPGLLLQNGLVYIAWASHCDLGSWHGWIMAYDAHTLMQKAVFVTTPNGSEAGIWMEGAGLAADASGNLFVATANGDFDTTLNNGGFPNNQDYGDSIVKLSPDLSVTNGNTVLDYFTPFDQGQLDGSNDQDLGSGGVLLLPDQPGKHPHLLVQGGKGEPTKGSTIYVIDRDQMTCDQRTGANTTCAQVNGKSQHFCASCASDTNILNELAGGALNTPVPVYWNSTVYVRGDADVLKAFSLDNLLNNSPPRQTLAPDAYSGRIIVSANGDSDGIVWSLKTDGAEKHAGIPAALNAYDAVDLSPLYSSDWNFNRDAPGAGVRFSSPSEANGRVYVGTSQPSGCLQTIPRPQPLPPLTIGCGQLSVFSLFGIGGYDLGSLEDRSFAFDYDGSGKLDHLVLYRPGTGTIWIQKNNAGTFTPVYQQGDPGIGIGGYDLKSPADRIFPFDYDSSGKPDHLVLYRPGTGTIWILKNDSGTFTPVYQQGDPGSGIGGFDLKSTADQVFPFDYDGSGKLDHLVLYRPGTGTIWILKNNSGTFTPVYQQGDPGNGIGGYDLKSAADRVIPFDYDGSGKLDHLVLYRPGTGTIWILRNSAGTFAPVYEQGDPGSGIGGYDLKSAADRLIPYDYDASGKLDHLALYRPGTGTIWILKNNAGIFTAVYQQGDPGNGIGGYDLKSAADRVIPFDYDGSGRADHLVLFRPGASTISILRDSAGIFAQSYAAW
jgi:hypothetical protein